MAHLPLDPITQQALEGTQELLHSGFIVVTTLTTCLAFAIAGNIFQYIVGNKRSKDYTASMIGVSKAITEMAAAVHEVKTVFTFVVNLYKEKDDA